MFINAENVVGLKYNVEENGNTQVVYVKIVLKLHLCWHVLTHFPFIPYKIAAAAILQLLQFWYCTSPYYDFVELFGYLKDILALCEWSPSCYAAFEVDRTGEYLFHQTQVR